MHIKKLVLDDFKSFGRRTEIPFYEDFTTVSGPNGSGKSNIIDAVLFALGLARSHGIRAEKLTDLIYNPGHADGESTDGPNEASVEVVLDNSDGTLSYDQVVSAAGSEDIGDTDEIRVKRRVKRTDANYYSYYYLNGRSVNLSDIRDLLSQAGVAPEGYNVVMQGDVTQIITMTAYRRREIIDEIAGVAEFDAKKEDAFEELEVVRERIDEAELRIEEKEERLEQLADERETALQYQELRDEKQEYEGYIKAAELEDKREELVEARSDAETRRETLEKRRSALDEKQGRVARLEAELDELNREIERKGEDEQLALQREIEEVKGEIARLEGEIEAAEARIEEIESRRRQAFVELDRKQEQIDDLESQIRERKLEKASVKAEIQEKESTLADIEAEIEAVGDEYEELAGELEARKADLEEEKSAKNDLQREQDRLLDEARRRSNEQKELEADLAEAKERLPEIEEERMALESELEKKQANAQELATVVDDLREERTGLNERLADIEDEIQALQQEYAQLEANVDERGDTSYSRAVTTILNSELSGVHGTVAQLGGVSEQYATACETAAGGRLACVVVDDDGVGERCIEHLKSRNAGRATFLPITEMEDRSLPPLPDHDGVVDFAINLVDFADEYAGIFSYVLSDTVVVDSIGTARELMGRYRLVTLEGDLVEKSGAMTGGSGSGTRYSFSKSGKGRLERVAEQISELEEERRGHREELSSVEDRLEDARERRSDAQDEVRAVEAEIERVDERRADAQEEVADLQRRLAEIEDEREEVQEEMADLESQIEAREETIAEIEAEIERLEGELSDSDVPELSSRADEVRAEIAELEDRVDDHDADLNSLSLEVQYAEEAIEGLHEQIETAQNGKAEQEERIEELEAEIDDREAVLEEKRAAIEALEDDLADLKAEREDLKDDLGEAKRARDEQHQKVSRAEDRLHSVEEDIERLEAEIAELEEVVEEYDPEAIPDHETVQSEITRLEGEMEALEPVNMLAIEEYDAVEADFENLTDRRETLVEEREAITDRIESYEAQKRETFMEAFHGIDGHFQDIFERLSDGTGRLFLENEEDPFEAGLSMKAEPGDKPIQRLDAMSGGEKSLTALAFIFAIQRYNPAPFYALDEIDAFLDAANAERVGEMVDELAADAQFIVVSHRAALLERSDRAIGVTMEENNLSVVTGIALRGDGDDPPEVSADD